MTELRDHANSTYKDLIGCVLCLEVAGHNTKPVFEQMHSTRILRQLIVDATAHVAPNDLVSIVREDSAQLAFLADPKKCFITALKIHQATLTQDRYRNLLLRIGINLGRVEIAEDDCGNVYLGGEGRQDARRAMRQAPPGQLSVARSFFELLAREAPELASLLQCRGVFSDTMGPSLCLYRLEHAADVRGDLPADGVAVAVSPGPGAVPVSELLVAPTAQGAIARQRSHRWLPRYALTLLLAVSGLFILVRGMQPLSAVSEQAAPVAVAAPKPTVAESAVTSPTPDTEKEAPLALAPPRAPRNDALAAAMGAARPTQSKVAEVPDLGKSRSSPAKPVLRLADDAVGHARPVELSPMPAGELASVKHTVGILQLAVRPWGEVYVDGTRVGVTPPLRRLEVPVGPRVVAIKNSGLTYEMEVVVRPDATIAVAHDFGCASPGESACRGEFGRDSKYALSAD